MSQRFFSLFGRGIYVTLKLLGVLLLAFAVAMGFVAWQVSKRPMDLEFARETIEAALYDEETGNHVQIEKAILYWPEYSGPLLLGLEGVRLLNKENSAILSVDEAALSFSEAGLLVGRLMPKTIILKKTALKVIRTQDNRIDVGLGEISQGEEGKEKEALMTRLLGYLARPGRESAKDSIISRLEAFEIENARLIVEDHKLGISWFLPDFNAGFFSSYKGLRANFDVKLPNVNTEPSGITVAMDYVWSSKQSFVAAEIVNLDTTILSGKLPELEIFRDQNIVVDAHLDAQLDKDFFIKSLTFGLASPQGSIFHPDLSEKAIPYTDLSMAAVYDPSSKTLIMDNTNISLNDVIIRAKADIKRQERKISGPLRIEINDAAQSQIGSLWPKALRGDNSEEWIVHKMANGRFQEVFLSFDLAALHNPETGWNVDAQNLKAGFAFKDMDLDYRAPMHKLLKANGAGTFDLTADEMKIHVQNGFLGRLNIKGADLLFDRLVEEGVGGVAIDMHLDGKLQDVVQYLAEDPLHMNDKMNMDISKVKGDADLKIKLNFPTRKDIKLADFKIEGTGTLKNILLPAVVENLDLSGGPFEISVKEGLFGLKGKGLLDQREVTLDYTEYLNSEGKDYKSKIKASLVADPNIRSKLGIDLSTFIEGSLPVNVEYTSLQDNAATASVDIDVTPAKFFIDPFDFEKAPDAKASAKLTAHFKNKEIQKITDLTASGEGFNLGKSSITFANKDKETLLTGGSFSHFKLGETEGKLDFEISKTDRIAKLVIDTSFLDIRPFLDAEETKGEYDQLPMMISVTASKMRTTDKETVRAAQIFIDMDRQGRFNQMEMDALAGSSAIYLRYKPDSNGKRTFRFKTDDAGAALKAFNIYNNIRGGTMVIYGEPVAGRMDRNLIGKAEISNFKAVKAPVLTKLLSILSLPGIIEVMSSDGLTFSKLEADFNWVYKKEGSLLELKNGRTSGNSIGLTFDGTFDNAKRMVDVEGTIIPMSGVNNMIGNIPLVGDILTGGSGSIFAATYSIEGTTDDPSIGVNPLSVITPGILRRILFE